jgi:hypothetical protein
VGDTPNAADEHQANDAGLALVCVGDGDGLGDVVAGTELGLIVLGLEEAALGTTLGGELGGGLDDEER